MELALIINLVLFSLFTGFLIVLSIDEARQARKTKKVLGLEELKKAA